MRSILFILMILTAPRAVAIHTIPACERPNPFFYRIEKDGKTSYILGTMHLGLSNLSLPANVQSAILSARTLAFEADRDAIQPFFEKLRASSIYTGGRTLREEVQPSSIRKLEQLFGRETTQKIVAYRPVAVLNFLEAQAQPPDDQPANDQLDNGLDVTLIRMAKTVGKNIIYLDQNLEQLVMSQGEAPASDVDDVLAYPDPLAKIRECDNRAMTVMCSGRESAMESYMQSECNSKFDTVNMISRSRKWIPILTSIFADGNALVAFGAGHLIGPEGVLALLRRQGFQVTRITEPSSIPVQWPASIGDGVR